MCIRDRPSSLGPCFDLRIVTKSRRKKLRKLNASPSSERQCNFHWWKKKVEDLWVCSRVINFCSNSEPISESINSTSPSSPVLYYHSFNLKLHIYSLYAIFLFGYLIERSSNYTITNFVLPPPASHYFLLTKNRPHRQDTSIIKRKWWKVSAR